MVEAKYCGVLNIYLLVAEYNVTQFTQFLLASKCQLKILSVPILPPRKANLCIRTSSGHYICIHMFSFDATLQLAFQRAKT